MVGTFYSAANPESKPFVSAGSSVQTGEIVCIIEAMKLFNEIESDISGTIEKICVENGAAVEFGQALFLVRQNNVTTTSIWQQYPEQASLSEKIATHFNCHPVTAQLMLNRSIQTLKEAEHFMNQTWDELATTSQPRTINGTPKPIDHSKSSHLCIWRL